MGETAPVEEAGGEIATTRAKMAEQAKEEESTTQIAVMTVETTELEKGDGEEEDCLLYTSPSPRD